MSQFLCMYNVINYCWFFLRYKNGTSSALFIYKLRVLRCNGKRSYVNRNINVVFKYLIVYISGLLILTACKGHIVLTIVILIFRYLFSK